VLEVAALAARDDGIQHTNVPVVKSVPTLKNVNGEHELNFVNSRAKSINAIDWQSRQAAHPMVASQCSDNLNFPSNMQFSPSTEAHIISATV
jgi:hypothetical protein